MGSDDQVSSINFIDKNIGYALLGYNKMLKTTNGGRTWKCGRINLKDRMEKFLHINHHFL